MTRKPSAPHKIFFEPWSLGDAIIAAATARELQAPATLAIHPAWHAIIKSSLPTGLAIEFLPVELPYTTRRRCHAFHFQHHIQSLDATSSALLSIRGDFRDYLAARRLFPNAQIKMIGWARFFARKNRLFDLPFRLGLFPVENRYRSWAKIAGVPFSRIICRYNDDRVSAPTNGPIVIHIGSQWRSKQFPHVRELSQILRDRGFSVAITGTAKDAVPDNIAAEDIKISENEELVALLRSARYVITNDSGPMHLATFLGSPTLVVARTASIEEWIPPGAKVVSSELTPRGYRQRTEYMTDRILSGWPSAVAVADAIAAELKS